MMKANIPFEEKKKIKTPGDFCSILIEDLFKNSKRFKDCSPHLYCM